jgi:hypothetical protein
MNIGLSNQTQTQTQIAESETQAYTLSGEKILFTDRTGTMHEILIDDLAEYMGYDNYLTLWDRMMMADDERAEYYRGRMEEYCENKNQTIE